MKKLGSKQRELAKMLEDNRFSTDVEVNVELSWIDVCNAMGLYVKHLDDYLESTQYGNYQSGLSDSDVMNGLLDSCFNGSEVIKIFPMEALYHYEQQKESADEAALGRARREYIIELLDQSEFLSCGERSFLKSDGIIECGILSVKDSHEVVSLKIKNLHLLSALNDGGEEGEIVKRVEQSGVHDEKSLEKWIAAEYSDEICDRVLQIIKETEFRMASWPQFDVDEEVNPEYLVKEFDYEISTKSHNEVCEAIIESAEKGFFDSLSDASSVMDERFDLEDGTWLYRVQMYQLKEAGQMSLLENVVA